MEMRDVLASSKSIAQLSQRYLLDSLIAVIDDFEKAKEANIKMAGSDQEKWKRRLRSGIAREGPPAKSRSSRVDGGTSVGRRVRVTSKLPVPVPVPCPPRRLGYSLLD